MTWQRIGHTTQAGTTDSPFLDPLSDIPLRATGDLMTYGVAFRMTTSPGIPNFSGSTQSTVQVASSTGGNNTENATGSIVSYVCGYRILTANDIANLNTFDFPSATDNAFYVQLAIYRANTAGVTPTLVANGGLVLGTQSTTVALGSGTNLSLTSGDLLIGYAFNARSQAVNTWTCTSPASSSGATGSTTANPIATNAWVERSDDQTAVGFDCSIMQVDGVMSSTTSTGNMQYSQVSGCRSGGHVMAFREVGAGKGIVAPSRGMQHMLMREHRRFEERERQRREFRAQLGWRQAA